MKQTGLDSLSDRVMVTNGWLRSSYAAARNLHQHDVKAYVSDSRGIGLCQASFYMAGFDRYRSHYLDEAGYVEDIIRIVKKHNSSLILPGHNDTEILAKHRELLPQGVDALLPDYKHCALFNNKARAYEYAKTCGVPVPARLDYTSPSDLKATLAALPSQPYVIKLLASNSAKGVFHVDSTAEVLPTVERLIREFQLTEDRFPQVEEKVEGDGWGCSALYWQGEPVAFFSHKRLREKIQTGGTSTLREAVQDIAVENAARKIFDSIGWHGLAMCEFKVCSKTGKFWFIEVNPRMWGSIPLAIAAGVEFPYLAWLCATKGVEAAKQYHANCHVAETWRARWLLGDLTVGAHQLLSGRFAEAYRTLFQANADSIDDFFWDDPFVFFGEVGAYVANSVRGGSLNPAEKGMIG